MIWEFWGIFPAVFSMLSGVVTGGCYDVYRDKTVNLPELTNSLSSRKLISLAVQSEPFLQSLGSSSEQEMLISVSTPSSSTQDRR